MFKMIIKSSQEIIGTLRLGHFVLEIEKHSIIHHVS